MGENKTSRWRIWEGLNKPSSRRRPGTSSWDSLGLLDSGLRRNDERLLIQSFLSKN